MGATEDPSLREVVPPLHGPSLMGGARLASPQRVLNKDEGRLPPFLCIDKAEALSPLIIIFSVFRGTYPETPVSPADSLSAGTPPETPVSPADSLSAGTPPETPVSPADSLSAGAVIVTNISYSIT